MGKLDFLEFQTVKEIIPTSKKYTRFQYAILFRRWSNAYEIWNEFSSDEREIMLNSKTIRISVTNDDSIFIELSNITIRDCIAWNYGYLKKYDETQQIRYNDSILNNIISGNELPYYSDIVLEEKNVFELFFMGKQPMLDVIYFECQEQASKQVKALGINLILDEVGTGKTVSALYCIRDVINEKQDNARTLIVCPNNKKGEWFKDIGRQLGRYAHIVENNDDNAIYQSTQKELFFKYNEPCIFIEGQKLNEMKDSLKSWTSEVKWDVVVIDEGHLCFGNYETLKSERTVLLTATPIVLNSTTTNGVTDISKIRRINDYVEKLKTITDKTIDVKIENLFGNGYNKLPKHDENRLFTCLYREDLGINAKKRKIEFLECYRWKDRQIYLDVLQEVKGGMTRLTYEQDDDFLLEGIYNNFRLDIEDKGYLIGKEKPKISNDKYEKLKEYLKYEKIEEQLIENNKSYIVFCNYIFVVDNLYKKLKIDMKKENAIIAYKYGGDSFEVYPKDNNVNSRNIFDYLIASIESGKQAILITTGATGGTGLNLGKFDGIINYELPFTCIELEQRFGRVDRMNCDAEGKEMIFILNDDENPMLRYSTMKINATCEYMPIRNTVLFYPEFVTKSIEGIIAELRSCKVENNEEKAFSELIERRQKVIESNNSYTIEQMNMVTNYAIKKRLLEGYDKDVEKISEYASCLNQNLDTILLVITKKRKYYTLLDEVEKWKNLLGEKSNDIPDNFVSALIAEDENLEIRSEYSNNEGVIKGQNIVIKDEIKHKAINKLWNMEMPIVDDVINKIEQLKNNASTQSGTSGIFYISDGKYIRQTIDEFRGRK